MDDLKIWRQLKSGDQKALKMVYDSCLVSLENYGYKFTSDIEMIEDAIHDLFIQIWDKRSTLNDTDSIIKYLCVSLRRELIRRLQKNEKTSSYEYIENHDHQFTISIEDILIQNEVSSDQRVKLSQGLSQLSSRQREAIFLKYYEGLGYDQICEVMQINYQSVRNLISKGILELKNHIGVLFLIVSWFCRQQ